MEGVLHNLTYSLCTYLEQQSGIYDVDFDHKIALYDAINVSDTTT